MTARFCGNWVTVVSTVVVDVIVMTGMLVEVKVEESVAVSTSVVTIVELKEYTDTSVTILVDWIVSIAVDIAGMPVLVVETVVVVVTGHGVTVLTKKDEQSFMAEAEPGA